MPINDPINYALTQDEADARYPLLINVSAANVANKIPIRDSNANFEVNAIAFGVASIATAGGTTTLTAASAPNQRFTGVTTQTVVLPDASTLSVGRWFYIANASTGAVTVNDGSGSLLMTLAANQEVRLLLLSNGTAAGSWLKNAVTGNGSIVLATAPTLTGLLTITGQANAVAQHVDGNYATPGSGALLELYNSSILRSVITSGGAQTWALYSGGEIGSVQIATPGALPGFLFLNASGTGRAQIRQSATAGGLGFGAGTGSGDPGDKMLLDTSGNLSLSAGMIDLSSDSVSSGSPVFRVSTLTAEAVQSGFIKSGSETFLWLVRSSAAGTAFATGVSADNFRRFGFNAGGQLVFGPGNVTTDTILQRPTGGGLSVTLTDTGTNNVVNAGLADHESSGTPAASYGVGFVLEGKSSTTASQLMARWRSYWNTATHASRKAYGALSAYDTAERDVIGWGADGSNALLGFFDKTTAPIAKPTVTGSRGANAALASLLTQLAALGLIIDSSS